MAFKLVVADSSYSVQKLLQLAFSEPDFEIYTYENGQELLRTIDQINPDAILLSLSLPGKDGYEVCRYLKTQEDFKKTSLVLLRGTFETLDPEKIGHLDYDALIQKPFDSEKLVQIVREMIDRKRGPHSFPEEPPEDIPPTGHYVLPEEMVASPVSPSSLGDMGMEEKIRQTVREEILALERELEKRLKSSLAEEIKRRLGKEGREADSETGQDQDEN